MKLSIITINLNNFSGLQKTIQSVISQSFKDFEYIIIDGGSTDGSSDIIKQSSDKITFCSNEPDTGIYSAMNKGIQQARGEYCLFLNSGDWLFNDDVLKDCFEINFNEDFVYGHQLKEQNGKFFEDLCLDAPYITFLTLKDSHIPHQCTFIKRELFNKIGLYNEGNKIISDWEFVMKGLFIEGCSIRRIPVRMTVYEINGISSIESYKKHQVEERRKFLYKQFPLFMPDYDNYEAFMQKNYIRRILQIRNTAKKLLLPFSGSDQSKREKKL
jgi:glycosyltransferase involved in cell wall biosynthesis